MAPSDEDRRFEALLTPDVIRMALRAVQKIVRNGDAQDVIQEACLSARKSLPTWRGDAKFSTWFYRVAVLTALQYLRKHRRESVRFSFDDLLPAEDYAVGVPHREREEERAERQAMFEVVRAMLPKLKPKHRQVILHMLFEGRSYAEVSALVGSPVLTIRTRLHYAKKHLVELIEQDSRGGELMRPSAAAAPTRWSFRPLYAALWAIARVEKSGSGGRPGPTRRLTYEPPQSLRGVITQTTNVFDTQEVARMVRSLIERPNWVEQVHGENDLRLLIPPSDSKKDDNSPPPDQRSTGPSLYVVWHFLRDERSKEAVEGEYTGKRIVRNPIGQIVGKWRRIDSEAGGRWSRRWRRLGR